MKTGLNLHLELEAGALNHTAGSNISALHDMPFFHAYHALSMLKHWSPS